MFDAEEQKDEFIFSIDEVHMKALMLCAELEQIDVVEDLLLEALNRDLKNKQQNPLDPKQCDISIRYFVPFVPFSPILADPQQAKDMVSRGEAQEAHLVWMKFRGSAAETSKRLRRENNHQNRADWVLRSLDDFIGANKLTTLTQ